MRLSPFQELDRAERGIGTVIVVTILAMFALLGAVICHEHQLTLPNNCAQQLPDAMSGRCPNEAHRLSVINGLAVCTCPARLP